MFFFTLLFTNEMCFRLDDDDNGQLAKTMQQLASSGLSVCHFFTNKSTAMVNADERLGSDNASCIIFAFSIFFVTSSSFIY